MTLQKRKPFRSRKLLDAARGEQCTMLLVGVCTADAATVIAAHSGRAIHGSGMGQKADDIFIAFACRACHDAYDGRTLHREWDRACLEDMWARAHARTIRRLLDMGVLKVG